MATQSYSWADIWTAAVTRPRVETFSLLLQDSRPVPGRAFRWLLLTNTLVALVTFNAIFNNPQVIANLTTLLAENGTVVSNAEISQALLITSVCVAPFSGLLSVGVYALMAGIIQMVADQMGVPERTRGKWGRLFFLLGAIVAPLSLVSAFAIIVPALSLFINLFILIYQMFLLTLAARALYDMPPRTAAVAVILPAAIFLIGQYLLVSGLFV
jgi:hypothetical protein